jgi:hypothetical protein
MLITHEKQALAESHANAHRKSTSPFGNVRDDP